MRLLRHPRGNGKISSTSEADEFSLVDENSLLLNKASVWSSSLKSAKIFNSTLTAAIVENSVIENSRVTGGKITDSFICAELIADYAIIQNSTLLGGNCRIVHTAFLDNVTIENLTVTGNSRLTGWTDKFDGKGGYISCGEWRRPPRILYLESGLTITESTHGFVFCGCYRMPTAHWLKVGERYGKKLGLTPEQVDEIRQFLLKLT